MRGCGHACACACAWVCVRACLYACVRARMLVYECARGRMHMRASGPAPALGLSVLITGAGATWIAWDCADKLRRCATEDVHVLPLGVRSFGRPDQIKNGPRLELAVAKLVLLQMWAGPGADECMPRTDDRQTEPGRGEGSLMQRQKEARPVETEAETTAPNAAA